MTNDELQELTIEQLEKEIHRLDGIVQASRAEMQNIQVHISNHEHKKTAQVKLAELGDDEKRHLAQELHSQGIVPASTVGHPGGNVLRIDGTKLGE